MRAANDGGFLAVAGDDPHALLETAAPETIVAKLDEGVRVIAGHREETAIIGRAHQRRAMPV